MSDKEESSSEGQYQVEGSTFGHSPHRTIPSSPAESSHPVFLSDLDDTYAEYARPLVQEELGSSQPEGQSFQEWQPLMSTDRSFSDDNPSFSESQQSLKSSKQENLSTSAPVQAFQTSTPKPSSLTSRSVEQYFAGITPQKKPRRSLYTKSSKGTQTLVTGDLPGPIPEANLYRGDLVTEETTYNE